MVISSFCRSCGEHFRVRKGVAIANPGLKVSGIAEIRPNKPKMPVAYPSAGESQDGGDGAAGITSRHESWLVNAEEKESGARALTRPDEEEPEEAIGISAGAFFGLVSDEESNPAPDDDGTAPAIGGKAHSRDSLARGSMAALIQSNEPTVAVGKDKMPPNYVAPEARRRTGDAVPENRVRCYRCYHVQMVSRFAKSTQCERCSAYISLANYEIKAVKSHTLRTRGDVTIAKKGGLINDSEIACHHLTVNGAIDAAVDCSGDAFFRHSGTVRGKLFCERLVIEKNCEVRFPDGVMTERADINGHLIGNVTCSGKVRLARTGIIEGDLLAVDLETKEGGRVSGETVIDAETKTELPLKKGFNPTIIG
jgi:cytoskeletal protein CcmA (bactofilin family)